MALSRWTVIQNQPESVELHRSDFGDPKAFDAIIEAYKGGSVVLGGGSPESTILSRENGCSVDDLRDACLAAEAGGVWTLDPLARSLLGIEED